MLDDSDVEPMLLVNVVTVEITVDVVDVDESDPDDDVVVVLLDPLDDVLSTSSLPDVETLDVLVTLL